MRPAEYLPRNAIGRPHNQYIVAPGTGFGLSPPPPMLLSPTVKQAGQDYNKNQGVN